MKWKHEKEVYDRFLMFNFNNLYWFDINKPDPLLVRYGLALYYSTLCPWVSSYIKPLEKLVEADIRHADKIGDGLLYPALYPWKAITVYWFNKEIIDVTDPTKVC